ncbi:uncharacterized protein LOC127259629 isoform X2 [Andrographis paniculata]|uniref:uncharacterized protein LOC127259629 isoform X2 n=1 Tax=Andrographis paniculata TaxID=175694 RepID=UPI0021E80B18|nr:uncharacterized protein LOC127259629 isoform X2 [Andrographis paniculata]
MGHRSERLHIREVLERPAVGDRAARAPRVRRPRCLRVHGESDDSSAVRIGSSVQGKLELTEESQPVWAELEKGIENEERVQISSGILSNDKQRLYFCTKNGTLFELLGVDPLRWENHGRPPGTTLATVADGAVFKPGLMFTISGAGSLYEYDPTKKPVWRKHVHREGGTNLLATKACSFYGVFGPHTASLFLLTTSGELIERRLNQRKWKWVVHGNPDGDHPLTSITCASQDENAAAAALFATAASGLMFEYRMQKPSGDNREDPWLRHEHPSQAPVASGVPGLQLQPGRLVFMLDDGRLGELHLSGHGGETVGPNTPASVRRKSLLKYVWSVLDSPITEGWNAEYCTEQRGPSNCIAGTKGETSSSNRGKDSRRSQQSYLLPAAAPDEHHGVVADEGIDKFFRLRLMQEGSSFFMVTKDGLMFEYLSHDDAWLWLRHEHSTRMRSVVGSYNGSLFTVDEHGSLLLRERTATDLTWTNCTAMRKGRAVASGPPWDSGIPGRMSSAKLEDSIFFVSRTGRLLQFKVAMRKFKWKDCKKPAGVKIVSIVDQERFRENVVFVVGRNGRLYQYNKVTEIWHEHFQSQHLVLAGSPGTAMRPGVESLGGSIFMISKDGGLVEYEWSSTDGWEWVEHGTPHTSNATLVGAPGPGFGGNQVFLVGSDGNVYLRLFDDGEWKWRNYGFPKNVGEKGDEERCEEKEYADGFENAGENIENISGDNVCDPKVSSTRAIAYSDNTAVFELEDGRLAEMRRNGDKNWEWSRIIGTPTSRCSANFWTSWAS